MRRSTRAALLGKLGGETTSALRAKASRLNGMKGDGQKGECEDLLAVKAEAGRPKDWAHIATAVESATPNKEKLDAILSKYGLLEKWRQKIEE